MRSILYAGILFVTMIRTSSSQVRVGYDGSLSTDKGADLSMEMQLGSPAQREDLLKALGVAPVYIDGATPAVPQTDFRVDEVAGTEARLLFLPCSGPGSPSAHLYLLQPGQDQHWHAVDHTDLDCWWQPSSYEWVQIQGKPRPSILAHHLNHDHGSGIVEDNMLLFEVLSNRLVKVLETEEFTSQAQIADDPTIQHSSTLLPFPDGSLEETRITSEAAPSADPFKPLRIARVERRRWRWVESSKSYAPGKFAVVHP